MRTRDLLGTLMVLALLTPLRAGGQEEMSSEGATLAELARTMVRAYHSGEVEALRPYLAPELVFRDPGLGQRADLEGFLDLVAAMGEGESERSLDISWVGATDDHAEVRGTWTATRVGSGRRSEHHFSIELELEAGGDRPLVVSWLDDFRRRSIWKPSRGEGRLETENFEVVYFTGELSADEAQRLGATLEEWYVKTSAYLGRSFDDGYRLHVNVAGGHASPYASDPGPDAFMLVPTRSAKREYGFSLVHELTHNLMGLSWLSRHENERGGVELTSGNRLFDEGLAVYVEEKLTGEGPRVWPNFGEETHAAYQRLRQEKGEPIWPVLEAEAQREHGDTRLAYLAQASFCKFLVESYGLERFERLFAGDLAEAQRIYGKDLPALEREWRELLEERFADAAGQPGG